MPQRSPKPPTPRNSRGDAKATGAPPRYDWSTIRREYLRGDDTVTLDVLSAKTGYPSLDTLKKRSSAEKWTELRAEFRHQVGTRMREVDLDLKTEVRSTLGSLGDLLVDISVRGASHIKPDKLEPIDIARFAKIGTDLKVKAAGMDEFKVRISGLRSPDDLDKLDERDLWRLAGMLPPEDDDDPSL